MAVVGASEYVLGMDTNTLFAIALGLAAPWIVKSVDFDESAEGGRGRLDLALDFSPGSRFPCPSCRAPCGVHDTAEKEWRHLDFFHHLAFLRARVPRTDCPEHGVLLAEVPWARPGSGFTLLFEAYIMLMGSQMPVAALARQVGEHDTRIWRLLKERVAEARQRVDMSTVRAVGADETSVAKRQRYVSLFVEPGARQARVLFVTVGHDHTVFHRFREDFIAHGGDPEAVRDLCMDMSTAFKNGAAETFPEAAITFDRFHVMKLVGDALDQVRRMEAGERPELRRTRFHWLRNPENLPEKQRDRMHSLSRLDLKTATVYHLRLTLKALWGMGSLTRAQQFLKDWLRWARRVCRPHRDGSRTGFEPMFRATETIAAHREGILHYFRERLTTAVLEGINSIIQAARSRARGYRNPETFITMIYLIAGRLDFRLPSLTHSR
jgi:transposase